MRRLVLAVAALVALCAPLTPVQASAPWEVGFAGVVSVPGGVWAPASPNCGSIPCPNGPYSYSIVGTGVGSHRAVGTVNVSISGSIQGWCGSMTGTAWISITGAVTGSGSATVTVVGAAWYLQGSLTVGGVSHSLTGTIGTSLSAGGCITNRWSVGSAVGTMGGA